MMKNDIMRSDCCLNIADGRIRSLSDSTDKELRRGYNIEKMYRNGEFDL